jgi:hypothetical protein
VLDVFADAHRGFPDYISGVIARMISPELHGVKSESKPYWLHKISPANLAVHNHREGFNSSFPGGPARFVPESQFNPVPKPELIRPLASAQERRAPVISVFKDALPSSSPQELLAAK